MAAMLEGHLSALPDVKLTAVNPLALVRKPGNRIWRSPWIGCVCASAHFVIGRGVLTRSPIDHRFLVVDRGQLQAAALSEAQNAMGLISREGRPWSRSSGDKARAKRSTFGSRRDADLGLRTSAR